jgi:hypothetical protein
VVSPVARSPVPPVIPPVRWPGWRERSRASRSSPRCAPRRAAGRCPSRGRDRARARPPAGPPGGRRRRAPTRPGAAPGSAVSARDGAGAGSGGAGGEPALGAVAGRDGRGQCRCSVARDERDARAACDGGRPHRHGGIRHRPCRKAPRARPGAVRVRRQFDQARSNHRAMRLLPKCSFSTAMAAEGPTRAPRGAWPLRKVTSTLPTAFRPNSR